MDVLRLLRGTTSEELAERIKRLLADERSRMVTETAIQRLPDFFVRRGAEGITHPNSIALYDYGRRLMT